MVKKLLNILLVRRTETENKWWHRLFIVLLFSSGIVVFILAVFLAVDSYNHTWITYRPVAFSLEPNYQEVNGNELPCDNGSIDTSDNEHLSFIIECKGVDIPLVDSKKWEALYETAKKNLEKQFGLDKYNLTNCNTLTNTLTDQQLKQNIDTLQQQGIANDKVQEYVNNYSQSSNGNYVLKQSAINKEFDCIWKTSGAEQADPAYPEYRISLNNIAHIKVARDINFGFMFSDIALWLIIPISVLVLWIVFWSFLIYRSVLYIVFGKKK